VCPFIRLVASKKKYILSSVYRLVCTYIHKNLDLHLSLLPVFFTCLLSDTLFVYLFDQLILSLSLSLSFVQRFIISRGSYTYTYLCNEAVNQQLFVAFVLPFAAWSTLGNSPLWVMQNNPDRWQILASPHPMIIETYSFLYFLYISVVFCLFLSISGPVLECYSRLSLSVGFAWKGIKLLALPWCRSNSFRFSKSLLVNFTNMFYSHFFHPTTLFETAIMNIQLLRFTFCTPCAKEPKSVATKLS